MHVFVQVSSFVQVYTQRLVADVWYVLPSQNVVAKQAALRAALATELSSMEALKGVLSTIRTIREGGPAAELTQMDLEERFR